MTEPGTEKRIDELSKRVDFGFEQTNERLGRVEGDLREQRADTNRRFDRVDDDFTAVRAEMKAGFDAVNVRFDRLQSQMTRFFAGTLGTIIAAVFVNLILSHS